MVEKLKKILIIDDERSIRATLKEILEFEKVKKVYEMAGRMKEKVAAS